MRAPGRNIEVGEAVRKLNPHLFGGDPARLVVDPSNPDATPRIRQSAKSKSNKLEREYGLYLQVFHPNTKFWEQDVRLPLANGCRYTVDWAATIDGVFNCWEVKGPHSWDDSIVKLKVAATSYPAFKFWLVDKLDGKWREQAVLP